MENILQPTRACHQDAHHEEVGCLHHYQWSLICVCVDNSFYLQRGGGWGDTSSNCVTSYLTLTHTETSCGLFCGNQHHKLHTEREHLQKATGNGWSLVGSQVFITCMFEVLQFIYPWIESCIIYRHSPQVEFKTLEWWGGLWVYIHATFKSDMDLDTIPSNMSNFFKKKKRAHASLRE